MSIPASLYHWSPRANRESILKDGIVPKPSREIEGWVPPYICASTAPHEGWQVTVASNADDDDQWDLWRIESSKAAEAFEQDLHQREWRTASVPSAGVELIDTFHAAPSAIPHLKAAVLGFRDRSRT